MKAAVVTGLIVLLLLACHELVAQQPVSDTINIEEFEVEGKKPAAELRSAAPFQHAEIGKMKIMPGLSAAGVLRNFSGVTIKDYGGLGGLKTVVVRSLGANHTAVFIDGAPVSDAATGQIDLSKIPIDDLSAVELQIGQGQQLCRSARSVASASTLSFTTVAPDFTKTNYHVKAGLKTGSFGVINPFAGATIKIGKQAFAGLSANYSRAKGDFAYLLKNGSLPDTTLRRKNADIEALNLDFSIESRYRDSSLIRIKTMYYGSERGLPGAVIYYNPYSSQRLTNRDVFGNIQYSVHKRRVDLQSNFNFSGSYIRYRDPAFLNNEGGLDNRYHQQEYYFSQAFSIPITGIFSAGGAADFFINSLQTSLYIQGNPVRYTGLGNISLQAKTTSTEATAVLLATVVKETIPQLQTKSRTAFSPSLTFITRLSKTPVTRMRLMYKNSFRMPTFHDLYYNLVGNDKLKPEIVNQFNGGLIFSFEKDRFESGLIADLFFNRVTDKIVAVPTQNLFVWSMRNLGRVDIRGLEVQINTTYQAGKSLELSSKLNYTHQKALDLSVPGSSGYKQQIPYIPFQTFSGFISVTNKRLSLGYNLLYNSHRYTLGDNIPANLLPSWWVHDIALSWQQSFRGTAYMIKAEIVNLFNKQYEMIRNFPMNGRGFFLTLSINH